MPICLSVEQLKIVEQYAKSKGLLNADQAIEQLINCCAS
jgi:hypothetical protein